MTDADPAKSVTDRIVEMGYITLKPKGELKPSSYGLEDGTLLQALINVSHLVQDPKPPTDTASAA